jgi:hypothetical protein
MAPNAKIMEAAETGKPLRGTNFSSKRARKAARKKLVRAAMSGGGVRNTIANARHNASIKHRDKQDFYRKLRLIKLRRHKVADRMQDVVMELNGLAGGTRRASARVRMADPAMVELTGMLIAEAIRAADKVSADLRGFARKKVLYTTGPAGGRR